MPVLGLLCGAANAQTNEWTWMGGPQTRQLPVYGTLGTASAGNMPGAHSGAVSWTDSKGNLWLFGGDGVDSAGKGGYMNALWEYSVPTNEWAWMGGISTLNGFEVAPGVVGTLGVPAAGNIPQGRDSAVGWTDAKGNLWLFGGGNYASSSGCGNSLNDLWEFNPSTNEWAWMGGSNESSAPGTGNCTQSGVYGTLGTPAAGNMPGPRESAVGWTDSKGNLWLFGGYGADSAGTYGYLNDLWEFSPSTNEWAWMGGSSTLPSANSGQPGEYGVQGIPATSNVPGGRDGASGWTDSNGNFWLFGGNGYDSTGADGDLNDLWEFNSSTHEWAWMGGASTFSEACANSGSDCGVPGMYGTLQTAAAGNTPGGRESAVNWTDKKGNFWLFGGWGFDSAGKWGWLNDLWEYNPSTSEWTWMSGSTALECVYDFCNDPGVYGTLKISALGNNPFGRQSAVGWTDLGGNLWLFGGHGYDVAGVLGDFSDLWEFQPNTGGQPVAAAPTFSLISGTYTTEQTVTISDTTPGSTIYYVINGNTPASEYTVPILISSSQSIEAIAEASGYANSNVTTATYTVNISAAAAPVFGLASGTYATAQTVTISDATPGSTIYYTTDGTMPTALSTVYGGPITVSSSEIIYAIAAANGYLNSAAASAVYTIGSNSNFGEWVWMGGSGQPVPLDLGQGAQPGVYGTLGVPAPGNIPGAVTGAVGWTDKNDNFWVFGAGGSSPNTFFGTPEFGIPNDLWEFNPATNEWTWMGGSSSISGCTSEYGCGVPGVYGTLGTPAAGNIPGSRFGASSWTDNNGNLWLFGGKGYSLLGPILGEPLNDLWEYNPTTNQWAWMSGSSSPSLGAGGYGQPGVYGTLGVPAPGNVPGSRTYASSWTDKSGSLWLFGGQGFDGTNLQSGYLNDLWKFTPSTNEWTWMGGSNEIACNSECGLPGVYGSLGIPAASNIPGSRYGAATWMDSDGNLWLFGGTGYGDGFNTVGPLNDLWKLDLSTNEWTWVSGANTTVCTGYPGGLAALYCGQLGVYGTLGIPAIGNTPGSRSSSAAWVDKNGNFWLFGGMGLNTSNPSMNYVAEINDLWEFNPSTNEWAWMGGNPEPSGGCGYGALAVSCGGTPGIYGTMQTPALGDIPGARTNALSWTDKSGNFWLFSGQGSTSIPFYEFLFNDVWKYQPSAITLPAAVTPMFSLAPGTYATGTVLTISNGMANASFYYTIDGTTPTTSSTLYNGPISLSASETIQAIATAPGYPNSSVASASYIIEPQTATPVFSVEPGTYNSAQTVTISDATPGAVIAYNTDGVTWIAYSGPITVSSTETIMAASEAPGYVSSAIATAAYTIQAIMPAVTVTPSLSSITTVQALSVTVSVSGGAGNMTPTGSVTLTSSTYISAAVALSSGSATINIPAGSLAAGTDTLTANYTPDSNSSTSYNSATGIASVTVTTAAGFTLSGIAVSVMPGAITGNTSTVTVTPAGGFTGSVTLTAAVTSSPTGAQYPPVLSFGSTSPVSISGTTAGTAILVISTTAATSAALSYPKHPGVPWYAEGAATLASILLLGIPARRRRWQTMIGILLLLVALTGGALACGGGGSGSGGGGGTNILGTTAGSYTITVTGTSGSTTANGTVTLTVQ